MFNKKIETKAAIHNLIASRCSGRAYDPHRLLSREQIVSLLEAARWAPSCFGDQPWRFILFDKASHKSAWENALACLAEGNQSWAKDAPLLLLACADSVLSANGKSNRWGQYDTGAASENLSLQATSLGLMAHQMGGFNSDMARELFNIPQQFTPMAMIAVGYKLAEDATTGEKKEYNLRQRNPLDNNFFDGFWGNPLNTAL